MRLGLLLSFMVTLLALATCLQKSTHTYSADISFIHAFPDDKTFQLSAGGNAGSCRTTFGYNCKFSFNSSLAKWNWTLTNVYDGTVVLSGIEELSAVNTKLAIVLRSENATSFEPYVDLLLLSSIRTSASGGSLIWLNYALPTGEMLLVPYTRNGKGLSLPISNFAELRSLTARPVSLVVNETYEVWLAASGVGFDELCNATFASGLTLLVLSGNTGNKSMPFPYSIQTIFLSAPVKAHHDTSLAVVLTIIFVLIALAVLGGGYYLFLHGKRQYEQINE